MAEAKLVSLNGLNTNLTNSNHWFAHFALEDILSEDYKDLDLHVTRFSLPQMEQQTMEASSRGYTKAVPTGVLNYQTKELTLEFLVDDKWKNYKALYYWMSSGKNVINPMIETTTVITPKQYLPLRIFLLDDFKKKIIQFRFDNTFIKVFNDIALEANNPGEVTASFTCCYDRFVIEDIPEIKIPSK